jgi:hypothetical protein
LTNGTTWNYTVSAQQKKWILNWKGCPQNVRKSCQLHIRQWEYTGVQKTKVPKKLRRNGEMNWLELFQGKKSK